MKRQFKLALLQSSFSGYYVLFALFVVVLLASFAFDLRAETAEILSLTTMFGYLGLRRLKTKVRFPAFATT